MKTWEKNSPTFFPSRSVNNFITFFFPQIQILQRNSPMPHTTYQAVTAPSLWEAHKAEKAQMTVKEWNRSALHQAACRSYNKLGIFFLKRSLSVAVLTYLALQNCSEPTAKHWVKILQSNPDVFSALTDSCTFTLNTKRRQKALDF